MILLIEECGRQETLYMHSKIELVDFYGSLGFYPIREEVCQKRSGTGSPSAWEISRELMSVR